MTTNNNQNQSNVQPVRSNFGTPTVAQAQAPPSTTNETTYTKFNMDDIEFEFDDRGNLIVVPSQQTQQSSEETDTPSTTETEFVTNELEQQPLQQSVSSDVNDRMSKIEGAIFQLASYLDSKEQTQVNTQNNNSQPNIDFQSDDWPTQIVSLINQSVSQAIDAKMKPMQNDFNSMRVRGEFQDAAARYGQPFLDLVPEMTEIKKSDPSVTWDILYQSMSKVRDKYNKVQAPTQDSTIRTNDVTNKNGKALLANANQLRTRANQIKTESSTANANIAPQPRQINSIDDAVNAALEELYG